MSLPERIAALVTTHSRTILVVLLLATVVIGAGASSIEQSSSLDQFETNSPEADAQSYADERFSGGGSDNTTSVQIITRGEDVLTRESLLSSLRFQQQLRDDPQINATLTGDQPMVGVENVVAQRALLEEEAEELEARADELEAEREELEAAADELENESQALENESEALEAEAERLERLGRRLQEDAQELQARRASLERRTGVLQGALNETSELQAQYDQLNRSYAAGEVSDEEYADESDRIEAEIDDTLTNATADADLDDEQTAQFLGAADQVRNLTSQQTQLRFEQEALAAEREAAFQAGVGVDPANATVLSGALDETIELQTQYDQLNRSYAAGEVSDEEYADQSTQIEAAIDGTWNDAIATAALNDSQAATFTDAAGTVRNRTRESNRVRAERGAVGEQLRGAFEAGTAGVFADEFAALRERGQRLQERRESLEESSEELEERGDELRARGDELEERGEELEDWGDELEERGEQLEADFEALEEREAPSLQAQIDHLESLNDSEFESAVSDALSDDEDGPQSGLALQLMPTSYEPGSTSADARMLVVTQSSDGDAAAQGMGGDSAASDAQLRIRDLAAQQDQEYVVFGSGVISEEIDQSMGDSLAIVGPLALLFVVLALIVAYRDPLDIVLGVVGIGLVLVWTFGFMGWAGIAFNQMFIAVPVLLIGLSIDYAIHVFMRHREQRQGDAVATDGGRPDDASGAADDARSVGGAMRIALAGVGVALVWVTATTVIGFLANLVSPIGPIQEFGVVSAFGILAALLVFGAIVPAAKVEADEFLEARGIDRRKRAFGTGDSRFGSLLQVGAIAARRAPAVVLVLALLCTAGGVYGASQVDTSFEEEDFLADSPPEWTQHLPGFLAPGEYGAKAQLEYVNENFRREDSQAQVLVQGDVADAELLERIAEAEDDAADSDVVYVLASGEADVRSPLSAMEDAAATNESFNESFVAADTDGDDVPDRNVDDLYDELLALEDGQSDVVHRTEDGEYEAVRMVVSVRGDAGTGETTEELRALADVVDDPDGRWSAIATGQPVVSYIVEQDLLDTVVQSLLITLVAVFLFLSIAYRLAGGSATLGTVTLLPVALSVSWILGTMYLVGIPFNVLTGMITSLTVGLGVAYSIHVSSRYTLELERQGAVWDAMGTTVTGTGGALLGSAATTIGGFGVLAFAILPALQQFGIITALTILYAFLASVIVLPTLLVLWTRYLGPDVSFAPPSADGPGAATGAGGGRSATASEQASAEGEAVDTGDTGDERVGPAEFGGEEE